MRGLSRPLALAALLACTPDGVTPSGAKPVTIPDWTSYTGTFEYRLTGTEGADGDVEGCDLNYSFTGEPADIACDDCEFAFTLDFTYEADESDNRWSCLDDESAADFSWTLGYDVDVYGYDIGMFWMYHPQGAYWNLAFYTALDGDTLSFHNDYYESAYYYASYVYTFDGVGTVSPG